MTTLLIANFFSLLSACFTAAASWTKSPVRTYGYQVGQCLLYAVASYFFGVYASIFMMLINAFRNIMVATKKYSFMWMALCAASALVLGLAANRGSAAGLLSVGLTVYYTVSSFYLTGPKAVKLNYVFDMSLYIVYDALVCDVPSGIVDFIGVVLALAAFFRILHDEHAAKKG